MSEHRRAIAAVAKTADASINEYDTIPGVVDVPAVVVAPAKKFATNDFTMGNGPRYVYELFILVPFTEPGENQNELDALLDPESDSSVIGALNSDPELQGAAEDSNWLEIKDYGGEFKAADVPHIGAVVVLEVHPLCQ